MKRIFYLLLILVSCQPDPVDRATGTDFPYPVRANGGLAITAPLSFGGVNITATGAEINFLSGVTSNIQTQLNGKAATSHTQAQSTITGLPDSLLNHYTKAQTATRLNLKLNILDTPAMLNRYINYADITGITPGMTADTIVILHNRKFYYIVNNMESYPNYYVSVSPAGNDANDGLSPATAWLTVAKVNGSTFTPGSRINFNKGDTWREVLTVPSDGSENNHITFSSYGTGAKPIITGADVFAAWTGEDAIYYTDFIVSPKFVFSDGIPLTSVALKASLVAGTFWRDVPNSRIYIFDDPGGHTMEMTVRDDGIDTNQNHYLTIDGISIKATNAFGVDAYISSHSTIKNCDFNYITSRGIYVNRWAASYTYMIIDGNTFNHIQGKAIYVGGSNDVICNNTITNIGDYYSTATPVEQYTAGIDIEPTNISMVENTQIYNNNIDGLDGDGSMLGSHGIYIQYTISGIDIYNNTVANIREGDGIKMAGSGDIYNNLLYNNYFAGVGTHSYTDAATVNIFSNIMYNNGYGVQQNDQVGTLTLNIYNNTFYKNGIASPTSDNSEIYIRDNITSLNIKNNIIYPSNGQLGYFYRVHATAFDSDYNIFYREDAGNFMTDAGTSRTFAAWQAEGYDAHSLNSNPLLTNPTTSFVLQVGSPAINTGTTGAGIPTTDYLGNPRVGLTDIGAIEKQ